MPASGRRSTAVVPPGVWQAARPKGDYTLVQCTVAPGFDFADFSMLRDSPERPSLEPRLQDWTSLL